ncbi:hypothetical protein D3C73_1287650 [compost metagenome]
MTKINIPLITIKLIQILRQFRQHASHRAVNNLPADCALELLLIYMSRDVDQLPEKYRILDDRYLDRFRKSGS